MVKRRELKQVHENFVLQQFSLYTERLGGTLKILRKPDPPDAIVEINGQKKWIEITDAFLDDDHAIGLTSGASEDIRHISDSGRFFIDPDVKFSEVLHSVISKKYDKKTIRSTCRALGAGILLVGVFTPFSLAREIAQSESESIANLVSTKSDKVFDKIFVYDGTGQISFHLIYSEVA